MSQEFSPLIPPIGNFGPLSMVRLPSPGIPRMEIPKPPLNLVISLLSNQLLAKPFTVSAEGIRFNLNSIQRNVFYEVEYEGEKFLIRVTEDGILERYEVERYEVESE